MSRRSRPQPTRPRASQRAAIWWRAILIVIAGLLAYANSLSGPFVFDDQYSIVTNPAIREWWNLERIFAQQTQTPLAGRPLVGLSFALNFAMGGLTVGGYHLANIVIHLSCALLLFGLVGRTLRVPRLADRYGEGALDLAFAIALLWTLHPLNTEAVDYLTQRTESMMALFYLLTVYAGARSLAPASRSAVWQGIAVLSCGMGMACKESMVTAPVMVVLYDRIFHFDSLPQAVKARWRFYGGLTVTWLFLAYLMLPGPRSGSVGFMTPVRPWTYLLNQTVMIARYLRLSFWPSGLVVNYGPPVPLTLGDVGPQAILVVALLSLTIAALRWRPEAGFLGAWLFIVLAPTSTIVPIATEVGAERRMYLPLMALVALVVLGGYSLARSSRRRSAISVVMAALVLVSASLAALTATRNREYASALTLAQTVLQRWPTGVAHNMVGSELAALHRDEEAIAELREAVKSDPRALYNLGVELFNEKKFDEAIHELQLFVDAEPLLENVPSARTIMGRAFAIAHKWPEAINQLTLVLSMTPRDQEARKLLVDVLNNQGLALADAGKFQEAGAMFRRAANLDAQDWSARHNLAAALLDQGDAAAAADEARQAIALNPSDAGSHDLLGRALAIQGKLDEAMAQFEQSLRIDPNDAGAREDLDRVIRARGQR
jgi:tetratricopeptide (TPR) repeat protein